LPATSGYFSLIWGSVNTIAFLVLPTVTCVFLMFMCGAFAKYRTKQGLLLSILCAIIVASATWDLVFTFFIFTYWPADMRTVFVDWLPPILNVFTGGAFAIRFTWEVGILFIFARYAIALIIYTYVRNHERRAQRQAINEFIEGWEES
ncbi:MAG: hypothetical protein ACQXXE_08845, partial [Candidatus Bathyarchaeia archaeon]